MMVNFMCQLDWAKGGWSADKTLFLGGFWEGVGSLDPLVASQAFGLNLSQWLSWFSTL